ncbi:hypothetical protein [Streptomyces cahuitamycinicus]|uniref:hypothetical protein n=1 Tax=Streptomyces cahuitamycinicus TaxID=2070367 RepID=UPI001FEB83EE|nr:hypothetical protein [Streptomyces cahuitamycinicus]
MSCTNSSACPPTRHPVNITRSRLGRLTRQGFLTQPGRGRYQRPMMHGWWDKQSTAEHKYLSWIGTWGCINDARIVLTERVDDGEQMMASWPEDS